MRYVAPSSLLSYSPPNAARSADGVRDSSSRGYCRPRYTSVTGPLATFVNASGWRYDSTQNDVSERALMGNACSRLASVVRPLPSRRMRRYQPGPRR